MCFMSVFREESETVLALKGLTPTGTLPLGILHEGRRGVQEGRHESETVLQLKGLNPGGKLPQGILSGGKSALVECSTHRCTARTSYHRIASERLDQMNERMPPSMATPGQSPTSSPQPRARNGPDA
ncbi:hypothetical protein COOONC_03000 [Cooperia oncophora]